ncbi:MAG: class I SAM-dependent methyltransferase [Gammaproteobacteria bacterium]|nr:class I SAM-dependent methyltransferase [Gammaproteobacteria bacterium]
MDITAYQCPACGSQIIAEDSSGISCNEGHHFPFISDSGIPVFESEDQDVNEYTIKEAAEIHDNALTWLLDTFSEDESELRTRLISRLRLQKGQNILVTGAGAGNDIPYIAECVGVEGKIFAQDYARQMLMVGAQRCEHLADNNIEFSVSDATNLPFRDNFFDAVYHFGGLNLFSDIGRGISEMDRVVKAGGRVVFGDEGLPPWLRDTEYGRMIINNNALCEFEPPLEYLPVRARDVTLSWEVGYYFYVIEYTASNSDLPIEISIPHVGKRGGSIESRYFGVLEGVNPKLKETLYEEAERRGLGRVEFLEAVLRDGLKK